MGYNNDAVVSVNITADLDLQHLIEITDVDAATRKLDVPFYYSVKWVSDNTVTVSLCYIMLRLRSNLLLPNPRH